MNKVIFTINEYGTIKINLKQIMDAQGINRNALAKATQTRFSVIDKWYGGHVERIDTDVLARICYALNCLPSDIIEYCYDEHSQPKQ